jgi:pimeloyl-ACP methyl ester carboxylesterase
MIWLSDLLEPSENFQKFFTRPDNKILDMRNVWLLNYRNMGDSDHHDSFALEDMSNDIVRFMDENKITLATIGGHGFGAKVATATAINHNNRFTGVMCLDGGPLDHRYYEAYHELVKYIEDVRNIGIEKLDVNQAIKKVHELVPHPKWRSIIL